MANAFVYPCDSYAGRAVVRTLAELGCNVSGGSLSSNAPAQVSTSYQVGQDDADSAWRHLLLTAGVVVFDLHGNERAAREALVFLSQQPFGGKEVTFIGISTPLVWANTRPAPLSLASAVDGVTASAPHTLSASLGVTGATSADGKYTWTRDEMSRRCPSASARDTYRLEQTVLQAARPGKLRTFVVCPGVLYGAGEDAPAFFHWARAAWEMNDGKAPLVLGPGLNTPPTLHVADLAHYVAALAGVGAGSEAALPSPGATAAQGGTGMLRSSLNTPAPSSASPLNVTGGARGATASFTSSLRPVTGQVKPPPPAQRYYLVADQGRSSQQQLAQAYSTELGNGEIGTISDDPLQRSPEQSSLYRASELLLLDLQLATTPLPPGASAYTPRCDAGPAACINVVATEFKQTHNLTPLRILLLGPPMSGKSLLAQHLAQQYGLAYINARELLAAATSPHPPVPIPSELAKAIATDMTPAKDKDGRVSGANMAALLRLFAHPKPSGEGGAGRCLATQRGFVLDGLPRSLGQARHTFGRLEPLTAQESAARAAAEAAAAEAAAAAAGSTPSGKDAKKGAPAAAAAGKGGKGAPDPAASGPDAFLLPPGMKVVAEPDMLPTHVVELCVSEEHMRARLAAVHGIELAALKDAEAAAAAAEAAAAAAGGKKGGGGAAKGGKKGADDGLPPGHNNEAAFNRRWDAYKRWRQEDADDLALRQGTAKAAWDLSEAARIKEEEARAAEAATLRAKRRAAKEAAKAAAAAVGGDYDSTLGSTLGAGLTLTLGQQLGAYSSPNSPLGATSTAFAADASLTEQEQTEGSPAAAGPALPSHGGVVGLCVDGGAQYIQLDNPTLREAGPALTAALPTLALLPAGSQAVQAQYASEHIGAPEDVALDVLYATTGAGESAEGQGQGQGQGVAAALAHALGQPHNFDSFPPRKEPAQDMSAEEAAAAAAAAAAAEAAGAAELKARIDALSLASHTATSGAHAARVAEASDPLRRVLLERVMPVVAACLRDITDMRPARPLHVLAAALAAAADAEEAAFTDPYLNPNYELQLEKIKSKKEREASREAAAIAKAERERELQAAAA